MGRSNPSALPCAVCGDKTFGRHYGAWVCDGCSCFFKRSVRRSAIYHCSTGLRQCPVDRGRRNWCQACRMDKCQEVGMRRELVQRERGPRRKGVKRELAERKAMEKVSGETVDFLERRGIITQTQPNGFLQLQANFYSLWLFRCMLVLNDFNAKSLEQRRAN